MTKLWYAIYAKKPKRGDIMLVNIELPDNVIKKLEEKGLRENKPLEELLVGTYRGTSIKRP